MMSHVAQNWIWCSNMFHFFFCTILDLHIEHSFMEDFVGCTPEALMVSFGADDLTGRAAQG
jgi:hypothetical protein